MLSPDWTRACSRCKEVPSERLAGCCCRSCYSGVTVFADMVWMSTIKLPSVTTSPVSAVRLDSTGFWLPSAC